jgi:hypothetical protein
MPAASEVVRQYARYHAFAFNLDIARPVFERAPDLTVVPGRITVLLRGLNRAATAGPDQGTYNDRNVDPFHKQYISRRSSVRVANAMFSDDLAARCR